MSITKRGGVLLRVGGELVFLSSDAAQRLTPVPPITKVPGAPDELLGVALEDDEILPVVSIGEARDCMIVCSHQGEKLGLVGGEVVTSGLFEADDEAILHGTERARPLDLAAIYDRVHERAWGGRWGG